MRLKLRRKLKNRKAFSLTELLAAVLILSMVSAVVAGGIPVAKDAYEKVTLSANAQVMLSTAITALRNELSTASNIKVGDTKIEYYSATIQNNSSIEIGTNGLWLNQYNNKISKKLVSDAVGAEKPGESRLYVTCDPAISEPFDYDAEKGVVTIKGLIVVDSKQGNKTLAHMNSDLKIRVIMGS